jgi:hypothetical protein
LVLRRSVEIKESVYLVTGLCPVTIPGKIGQEIIMSKRSTLLFTDGVINLALGLLLLIFPDRIVQLLGVPPSDPAFYPKILGAVLIGIGLALFIDITIPGGGLGLWGAIAINICGGSILGALLLFGGLSLAVRGYIFLWLLVGILVGISFLEGWTMLRRRKSE